MNSPRRTLLIANKEKFTLSLFVRPIFRSKYRLIKTYNIAIGAAGFDTPDGPYAIRFKAKCPDWLVPDTEWAKQAGYAPGTILDGCTDANPLKERWLGVTDPKQGVGIHGTASVDSLGSAASHGCIRMDPFDVIELYNLVPKGTTIVIL